MPSTKPMTRPAAAPRPREDHGLFGPGSPTWRVWTSPTALIAFQRSIVVETFDPFLAAAVEEQNGVRSDPRGRFERTAHYFQTVAVGDSRAVIEASEILTRVHAKATGTEPISGLPYSANDPDSQLWIHITGWHSNLLCYERFGPGPLSARDEHRYWAECAIAAELQTCDPAAVPRTRSDVRDYYATVRPRLCVSEHAGALLAHFLRTPPRRENAELWATSRLLALATIATIPRWMRRLGGFDRPPAADAAIVPVARLLTRALSAPDRQLAILEQIAPAARRVVEPALRGEPPLRAETVTPAEARARYGDRSRAATPPRRAAASCVRERMPSLP